MFQSNKNHTRRALAVLAAAATTTGINGQDIGAIPCDMTISTLYLAFVRVYD